MSRFRNPGITLRSQLRLVYFCKRNSASRACWVEQYKRVYKPGIVFETPIYLFERVRPRGNPDCFLSKMQQGISVMRIESMFRLS